MNMDESWCLEWQSKATPEEKRLVERVYDFGDLFNDMLFTKGSSTYDLIKCQTKMQESSEWVDDELSLPDELSYFSYTYFHFEIDALDDCDGRFDHETQTLTVSPDLIDSDSTLLHEMIHLHEYVINGLPLYFHDMLYWALYEDLKKRIPGLDEIITGHAHLLTGSSLYAAGGLHDILFLLKSFDLDIRQEYSLGTVFSYGRDEELKKYSYTNTYV